MERGRVEVCGVVKSNEILLQLPTITACLLGLVLTLWLGYLCCT